MVNNLEIFIVPDRSFNDFIELKNGYAVANLLMTLLLIFFYVVTANAITALTKVHMSQFFLIIITIKYIILK